MSRRRIPVASFVFALMLCLCDATAYTKDATQKPKWDWPPVPLYITSAGASNGRTDPSGDNLDSVKDIASAFRKNPLVTIVERQEDARIVLVVEARERGEVGPLGRDYTLVATLRVDGEKSPIRASVNGGTVITNNAWKRAAERIAEQVHKWVVDNRSSLK